MLGPAKSRRLDQPVAVSLEALIPADHFYRHLENKLDLSFVREWISELYAERGRNGSRLRRRSAGRAPISLRGSACLWRARAQRLWGPGLMARMRDTSLSGPKEPSK
jgi:hypothetical protein